MIENIKTFNVGSGKRQENVYLTLDLIPIHVIFNYDMIESSYIDPFGSGKIYCEHQPNMISNLYTKEIYQSLIDRLCERLELPPRDLICLKELPLFDFNGRGEVYEYQYDTSFYRKCYTKTKVQNVLKFTEQYRMLMECPNIRTQEQDKKMCSRFHTLFDCFQEQKILKNRDWIEFSTTTVDNFIGVLSPKKRIKKKQLS